MVSGHLGKAWTKLQNHKFQVELYKCWTLANTILGYLGKLTNFTSWFSHTDSADSAVPNLLINMNHALCVGDIENIARLKKQVIPSNLGNDC